MKKVQLFLLLLVIGIVSSKGQEVQIFYDQAGNRILRKPLQERLPDPEKENDTVLDTKNLLPDKEAKASARLKPELLANINKSVEVFPNPTKVFLYITLSGYEVEQGDFYLKIYDVLGREILSTEIFNSTTTLNMNYPSGTYFLKISHKGDTIYEDKIVRLSE